MSPENKLETRKKVYYKYVEDLYKSKHLDAPGAEAWASKTFIPKENLGGIQVAGMSGAQTLVKIAKGLQESSFDPLNTAKLFRKVENKIKDWRADHYSDVAQHKAADIVGEIAGETPLWIGIGEGAASLKVAKKLIPMAINATKLPLSKLLIGPAGKFVGRRLIQAAEGYVGGRALGQNNKDAAGSGAAFSGGGAILEGASKIGKLAIVGAGHIFDEVGAKHYLSELLSNGGWRFAKDVLSMSKDELEKLHASDAEKIKNAEKFAKLPRPERDPLLSKLNDANKHLFNGLSQKYFQKNYQFLNPAQREEVFNQLNKGMLPQAVKEVALNKNAVAREVAKDLKNVAPEFHNFAQAIGAKPEDIVKNVATASVRAAKVSQGVRDKEINNVLKAIAGVKKIGGRVVEEAPKEEAMSSVGAARKNSLEFLQGVYNKYLPQIPIKLQGSTNKLIFAWAKATPKEKILLESHLKGDSELGKYGKEEWDQMAKTFREHVGKLIRTGHIPGRDRRGVFASTRLHADDEPSRWQLQLEDELFDLDKEIDKNIKNKRAAEIAKSMSRTLAKGKKK